MRKSWRDHLPPAVRRILSEIKALPFGCLMRLLYPRFARRPIQAGKIVFDNYLGRGYGCNPKYVAKKLIERGADGYDLVWLVSREHLGHSELPPQIRAVRHGSLRSYYEYATAQVWVSNYPKMLFVKNGLKKRAGQVFIQTCHGSLGIKKIDGDAAMYTRNKSWLRVAKAGSEMTDWWISNSDFETGVYKSAFWGVTDEKVLLYGHPRNDIFFDGKMMALARQKVDAAYGTAGKKLLLYAPTFRNKASGDQSMIERRADVFSLDYPELLEHLRRRLGGEWAVLVRLHPRIADMAKKVIPPGREVIDATDYMDMQELLAAADCLLTDYSSCAFDFMLTRRPVFLYATDIHRYDTVRGFYYPLESTPFPLAHDNAQLQENIDFFDEAAYLPKVEAFLKEKGCVEDGRASERVAELIECSARQTEA